MTAYGLRNRARNASPVGIVATSDSSTASIITMRSEYTARARNRSPAPSASVAVNAFGPSWMPAPISPISADCSTQIDTITELRECQARRKSANAAADDDDGSRGLRVFGH